MNQAQLRKQKELLCSSMPVSPFMARACRTLAVLPAGRDNQVSVFLSGCVCVGLVLRQLQAWTGSEEGGLLEDLQIACRWGQLTAGGWHIC